MKTPLRLPSCMDLTTAMVSSIASLVWMEQEFEEIWPIPIGPEMLVAVLHNNFYPNKDPTLFLRPAIQSWSLSFVSRKFNCDLKSSFTLQGCNPIMGNAKSGNCSTVSIIRGKDVRSIWQQYWFNPLSLANAHHILSILTELVRKYVYVSIQFIRNMFMNLISLESLHFFFEGFYEMTNICITYLVCDFMHEILTWFKQLFCMTHFIFQYKLIGRLSINLFESDFNWNSLIPTSFARSGEYRRAAKWDQDIFCLLYFPHDLFII